MSIPTGFSSQKLFERKKGLLICSLNASSLLKHKDEIEMLLCANNIDILALNETKVDETISICRTEIDGYNHERFDRNRHGGRGLYLYKIIH